MYFIRMNQICCLRLQIFPTVVANNKGKRLVTVDNIIINQNQNYKNLAIVFLFIWCSLNELMPLNKQIYRNILNTLKFSSFVTF